MEEPKIGVNTGNRGKGRPKGAKNKTTALLKDAILMAAEEAGGEDGLTGYLKRQATENPAPFMALLGKVLPMQIIGDAENPIRMVTRVELVAPSHDNSQD
jgi:hypothetical protein